MIRDYEAKDYAMLCKWWSAWKWPEIPEMFLSRYGIISNEMASGFLYITNSKIAWIEWLLTDKEAPVMKRKESILEVIEKLEKTATDMTFKVVFTTTNKRGLSKLLEDRLYLLGDKDMRQYFKNLGA